MTIAQQVVRLSADTLAARRAQDFRDLARAIMLARGGMAAARKIAEDARLGDNVVSILSGNKVHDLAPQQRAAVSPDWGDAIMQYDQLADAFIQSLAHHGALDRVAAGALPVPFRTRIVAVTAAAGGSASVPSAPKAVSRLSLSNTAVGERKATAIIAASRELVQFSQPAAGRLFAIELANSIALAADTVLVAILAAGAPSFASSGPTAEHARLDLRSLLTAITTSGRSQLFVLMGSTVAKCLAAMHTDDGQAAFPGFAYKGGTFVAGVEGIVTDALTDEMILVDATQLGVATGTVVLDASEEATIELSDTPDDPVTASTTLVSLFQSDLVALKSERFFAVEKLTATGAARLVGISYTGSSPGP